MNKHQAIKHMVWFLFTSVILYIIFKKKIMSKDVITGNSCPKFSIYWVREECISSYYAVL